MGLIAFNRLFVAAFLFLGAETALAQQQDAQQGPVSSPEQKVPQEHKKTRPIKPLAQVRSADIDKNGVLILVKSALIALDQANRTGNYTVLRDLGSHNFQANTAARLAEIFAPQRQQKLDLAGIIVLEPQLTLLPQIEPNGMLHLAGFFPSTPVQVNFELLYEPVNREWRLYGLSVNLSSGGPKAPETVAADEPEVSRLQPKPPTVDILPSDKKTGK
ncbi:hypothetical protein [Rhizobium lusitanum]|uniref:DUF4864 domain-containing protein n=1 Tax=Rhizobium lusitanum TaxID=293958 RepID=A0A7X0IXH2_9HYPH|nr:hypothetical protein [Rhizobium lusitanum]MBB6488810.1 hypothetical protein [Rhizobium lusitanum]